MHYGIVWNGILYSRKHKQTADGDMDQSKKHNVQQKK